MAVAAILSRPWDIKPQIGVQINWNHPLSDKLRGLYLFSGEGAGKIFDAVGERHLTQQAAPVWKNSPFGSCLEFNGTSQYLDVAQVISTAYPVSVTAWHRTTSTTVSQALAVIQAGGANNHLLRLYLAGAEAGDNVKCTSRLDATTISAVSVGSFLANVWQHAGGRASAAEVAVFRNGTNKGTVTNTVTPTGINTTVVGRFSQATPSGYMTGRIDLVKIWNRALKDEEFMEDYLYPFAVFKPQTHYWLFGQAAAPPAVGARSQVIMIA